MSAEPNEMAAYIRRRASKYESNSCGMTDADGEKYDAGYIQGMRDTADIVERVAVPPPSEGTPR